MIDATHLRLIRFPRWIRVSIGFGTDAFRIADRKHI